MAVGRVKERERMILSELEATRIENERLRERMMGFLRGGGKVDEEGLEDVDGLTDGKEGVGGGDT
ncbi:hypothetical protein HDU67_005770, partial [Dinochytrium kinnereticum]